MLEGWLLWKACMARLCKGPTVIAEQRVKQCKRILKLVSDLKDDEDKLHTSMHPKVARVLQGKTTPGVEAAADRNWL